MNRERQLKKIDKEMKELKSKYYGEKYIVVIGDDCKYCKDSNHSVFCCESHKKEYDLIMAPVNAALGR